MGPSQLQSAEEDLPWAQLALGLNRCHWDKTVLSFSHLFLLCAVIIFHLHVVARWVVTAPSFKSSQSHWLTVNHEARQVTKPLCTCVHICKMGMSIKYFIHRRCLMTINVLVTQFPINNEERLFFLSESGKKIF